MPYNPAGYYYSTSPPVVAAGKIIVGGAVNDNYSTQEQSGVIRAFDINTGALIWNWDSGNPDVTTPLAGGPDLYPQFAQQLVGLQAPMKSSACSTCRSATRRRTSSARAAADNVEKFSSSIVALDLNTGQLRWVRQTVHHDLWDMDVPAQPTLLDITYRRRAPFRRWSGRPSRATSTCSTGAPASRSCRSEEVPAPTGAIEGDHTAPTQPVSALTFMPQPLDGQGHVGRVACSTSWPAASSSSSCATRAAIRRHRCRDR